jgi:hypothetical protein
MKRCCRLYSVEIEDKGVNCVQFKQFPIFYLSADTDTKEHDLIKGLICVCHENDFWYVGRSSRVISKWAVHAGWLPGSLGLKVFVSASYS